MLTKHVKPFSVKVCRCDHRESSRIRIEENCAMGTEYTDRRSATTAATVTSTPTPTTTTITTTTTAVTDADDTGEVRSELKSFKIRLTNLNVLREDRSYKVVFAKNANAKNQDEKDDDVDLELLIPRIELVEDFDGSSVVAYSRTRPFRRSRGARSVASRGSRVPLNVCSTNPSVLNMGASRASFRGVAERIRTSSNVVRGNAASKMTATSLYRFRAVRLPANRTTFTLPLKPNGGGHTLSRLSNPRFFALSRPVASSATSNLSEESSTREVIDLLSDSDDESLGREEYILPT